MELASKSVSFSFNNIMYWYADRISMQSYLGPLTANVFVRFLARQLFVRVTKPYFYIRYVDDTFACFSSRNEA